MAYKVQSTIKHGTKDGNVFFDVGETISAKDVGGKNALDSLIAAGAVVNSSDFVDNTPEVSENLPSSTPSNTEVIEGTDLEAKTE